MAVWWMSEAVPIPVTALLPLVLFPALGILSMPDAAQPYAHELIFLFMGGFFLATAMEASGLHRRVALAIVAGVGTGPERLVLGFMLATAALSMWISNTATTAMMLPIAVAVAHLLDVRGPGSEGRETAAPAGELPVCLMLGIAWAASIGGVATLIGTPPNAVLAGAADELLGRPIGFGEWMTVGLPLTVVMLPLAWLLLVRVLHRPGHLPAGAGALLARERDGLGPRDRHETVVAIVFALAAAGWILREPRTLGGVTVPGLATWIPGVRDSTVAMAAALLLFLVPVSRRRPALTWPEARTIPWGVLILFGGGLSLARGMERSGLAAAIGTTVSGLGDVPPWVLMGFVAVVFIFLTELTSNTATATMAMPILAGAATGLQQPALPLMATAAMAASMAFMLPVATPPNAMVFGSGLLTIPQMAGAGFWLNLLAVALVTAAATALVPVLLVGP
jgi:sodium-dependent dicarboxylate transporter 2/3/5